MLDCIYESGTATNLAADVLSKLVPGCQNMGGFRKARGRKSRRLAYVVLVTTLGEIEWPDYLDSENGVFRYYGDNRTPGKALTDTPMKGNAILEQIFSDLNAGRTADIPPILVFASRKLKSRDMRFLGLAVPGVPGFSPDKELVAFWRSKNGDRFQNYEAHFSILDTSEKAISRRWFTDRIEETAEDVDRYAPEAWLAFKQQGRAGIRPLRAKKLIEYPSAADQLQSNEEGRVALQTIREYYAGNPYEFEQCATDVIRMTDPHFVDFKLTRPWRDGGRDAVGYYEIRGAGPLGSSLRIDCAMEAKCYSPAHSVGVREMSRLISRIRYRQFGILVTTSYVHKQAYLEVKEDRHPILMLTGADIATVLQQHNISSKNDVKDWLGTLADKYLRM